MIRHKTFAEKVLDVTDDVIIPAIEPLITNDERIITAYSHAQSTHAPANAQVNADITKSEIEAKLTGEITSHSHAGGGGGGLTQQQIEGLI